MRSLEKNRKQRPTAYLPISIKLVVKIALGVLGFCVWGTGFVWVLVGLYFFLPLLRGILSCLLTLGAVIAFIYLMLTFL
jgi:hypothetical protein